MIENNYKPPFTITSKILSAVSHIVEVLSELKHIDSVYGTPQLRKKSRIKTITGTLQIEGNTFSEEKVTAILDGKRVLGSTKELAEVKGAIRAYEKLAEFDYRDITHLLNAHKWLMDDILTNAGSFRKKAVGVFAENGVSHIAPPPTRVPELMENLFSWLQTTNDHPLIVSSVFHYEFEFIHPFIDGNGRIGRLWQSVILNQWKDIFSLIPIESVVRDYQENYYKALEESGTTGESTIFVEFMLEVILEAIQNNLSMNHDVPLNDPNDVPLKRADKIVSLIQENQKITLAKIAAVCEVSEKTIKRDIAKLKAENRVARIGSLKSGHWAILNDI